MASAAGLRLIERQALVIEKVAAQFHLFFGHGIILRHLGQWKTRRQFPLVGTQLFPLHRLLRQPEAADMLDEFPALRLVEFGVECRHTPRHAVGNHPIDFAVAHRLHQIARQVGGTGRQFACRGSSRFAVVTMASGAEALVNWLRSGSVFGSRRNRRSQQPGLGWRGRVTMRIVGMAYHSRQTRKDQQCPHARVNSPHQRPVWIRASRLYGRRFASLLVSRREATPGWRTAARNRHRLD